MFFGNLFEALLCDKSGSKSIGSRWFFPLDFYPECEDLYVRELELS